MKPIRLILAAGTVVSVLVVVPASADHADKDYCSPSGDVCASTKMVNGVRKLRISTVEKYFSRYVLCVTAPDETRECKTFRIERQGQTYGDSVRWRARFPWEGRGDYYVRWRANGDNITPKLGFHIR